MKLWRAFKREERGATAVEFALVAPMVVTLLVATVEIGVLEMLSSNLDAAVMIAAREIRTGQSDRPTTNAAFVDLVCANMVDSQATCRNRLATSVKKTSDFASAQALTSVTPSGQFDATGPGDVVVVQATYSWPLILPMYAGNFRLNGPNQALLDARAAFRNEPFG